MSCFQVASLPNQLAPGDPSWALGPAIFSGPWLDWSLTGGLAWPGSCVCPASPEDPETRGSQLRVILDCSSSFPITHIHPLALTGQPRRGFVAQDTRGSLGHEERATRCLRGCGPCPWESTVAWTEHVKTPATYSVCSKSSRLLHRCYVHPVSSVTSGTFSKQFCV